VISIVGRRVGLAVVAIWNRKLPFLTTVGLIARPGSIHSVYDDSETGFYIQRVIEIRNGGIW
jgi:hypothetical protein